MTPAGAPSGPPPALPADEAGLLALFHRYDFRDPLGHPLTGCEDFLALVRRAVAARPARPAAPAA